MAGFRSMVVQTDLGLDRNFNGASPFITQRLLSTLAACRRAREWYMTLVMRSETRGPHAYSTVK